MVNCIKFSRHTAALAREPTADHHVLVVTARSPTRAPQ
jgi:hypothetical protein